MIYQINTGHDIGHELELARSIIAKVLGCGYWSEEWRNAGFEFNETSKRVEIKKDYYGGVTIDGWMLLTKEELEYTRTIEGIETQ